MNAADALSVPAKAPSSPSTYPVAVAVDDVASAGEPSGTDPADLVAQGLRDLESRPTRWYSYLATADFYAVVALGQVLALCITATNTFTTFLAERDTNIPAFQTLFNYALLCLAYTAAFWLRDEGGPRRWAAVLVRDGWRYALLALFDVEGNYFTVLAYRHTNILSAQLINFWAIVCVVAISFTLLRVRYRVFQVVGILVCCGGMGVLLASDHVTGSNGGEGSDMVKGDLFALLGATCYGVSNVFEEYLVSRRPVYEVVGFLGLFGLVINGAQAAIFDRHDIAAARWPPSSVGYLAGYTLCLSLFYSLAPLVLRMGSAAFFDISLLTGNFWGVIIGVHVFGYAVHFLYPVAFVLIIVGLATYFLTGSVLGDSKKPWLGDNQEAGVAGLGTAKLKAINAAKKKQQEEEREAVGV